MTSELIPLKLEKIMQTRSYSVVVLKAKDGSRFAIYTDPQIGQVMQMYLTGTAKQRPLTHDLFSQLFKGMEIHIKQVVINDLQDTVYFARLYLEQKQGEMTHLVEIDARPSDCLALALLNNIPLFATQTVLEKTVKIKDEVS